MAAPITWYTAHDRFCHADMEAGPSAAEAVDGSDDVIVNDEEDDDADDDNAEEDDDDEDDDFAPPKPSKAKPQKRARRT